MNGEPCWSLSEVNLQSPGSKGWHRYRIMYVVRNDRLAEYREDLGPVTLYKGVEQFRIPGGVQVGGTMEILHTVEELVDIANFLHVEPLEYNVEKTDFAKQIENSLDDITKWRKGQSTFGPHVSKQRSR